MNNADLIKQNFELRNENQKLKKELKRTNDLLSFANNRIKQLENKIENFEKKQEQLINETFGGPNTIFIGANAFNNGVSSTISTIYIPSSVEAIDNWAFAFLNKLSGKYISVVIGQPGENRSSVLNLSKSSSFDNVVEKRAIFKQNADSVIFVGFSSLTFYSKNYNKDDITSQINGLSITQHFFGDNTVCNNLSIPDSSSL